MRDFSYFQYLFIGTYSIAYEIGMIEQIAHTEMLTVAKIKKLTRQVKSRLAEGGSQFISKNVINRLPIEDDIFIQDICRENPIKITFSGLSLILVVAIVISGGKIEISSNSVKAELPALGKGIQEIRNVFIEKDTTVDITDKVNIK